MTLIPNTGQGWALPITGFCAALPFTGGGRATIPNTGGHLVPYTGG